MRMIYFTADLHIGHQNILKYNPGHLEWGISTLEEHDAYLIDLWRSTVQKIDDVYILGDLTFYKSEDARHLLEKLPGRKHLIEGNHDGSVKAYSNYFSNMSSLEDIRLSARSLPFLQTGKLFLTLCHYPLLTWNHKPGGALMLHGHCHGKLDDYNAASQDLRFDVGIDGELSKAAGGFIPAETLYEAAVAKAGGQDFSEYAQNAYTQEQR